MAANFLYKRGHICGGKILSMGKIKWYLSKLTLSITLAGLDLVIAPNYTLMALNLRTCARHVLLRHQND